MFPFNIIKLGSRSYLFKYNIGEFEMKFRQQEKDIINILLKDNLNRIVVIYQNMNEFILIYESYKHYSIDPIELRESDEDNDEFLQADNLHNDSYIDVYFEE